jgi:predicted RNA binding protein YcfA (HicA-like mRNA interferase family)
MPALKRANGREVVRALEQLGWRVDRIRGSHHIMRNPAMPRVTLSVPVHRGRTIPLGTLASILKDADVDIETFNQIV